MTDEQKNSTAAGDEPKAKATPKKSVTKSTTASKATTAAKGTTASKSAKATSDEKPAKADGASTSTASKPAKPAAKKDSATQADAPASRPQILKAHHLRPAAGAKKDRTRVGRGEASKGKTAGRGTKGTKARYQVRQGLEGGNLNAVMRAPKLRGFTNPFRLEYQVVNLGRLAELYPAGGDVTVEDLVAKGAVRKNEKVKVLGDGDISVKLSVAVDKVSSSAEQKIVAAGGSVR